MKPFFSTIDCVSVRVADLRAGLEFYSDRLGHPILWKTPAMAGMAMPGTDAELVVHTDPRPMEAEFVVDSAEEAVRLFRAQGGRLVEGPFEIQIGRCAVLADPWGNRVVVLDRSKGRVQVDRQGNVISRGSAPGQVPGR